MIFMIISIYKYYTCNKYSYERWRWCKGKNVLIMENLRLIALCVPA
jgi:hypothetical protein